MHSNCCKQPLVCVDDKCNDDGMHELCAHMQNPKSNISYELFAPVHVTRMSTWKGSPIGDCSIKGMMTYCSLSSMKVMPASYKKLNVLQNRLTSDIPKSSSHRGKMYGSTCTIPLTAHPCPDLITSVNFAYDLVPNFKEGDDVTCIAVYMLAI